MNEIIRSQPVIVFEVNDGDVKPEEYRFLNMDEAEAWMKTQCGSGSGKWCVVQEVLDS